MEKRYIKVPAAVTCVSVDGRPVQDAVGSPVVVTFAMFVKGRCTDAAVFGASMKTIVAQQQIVTSLTKAEADSVWEIDLDNYELLLKSVESPGSPYEPMIAGSLLPFMFAIKDASREAPSKAE